MALIPAPVLAMKKLSINRAMEAQGFLASVNAIAESDAILHLEPSVLALRQDIASLGLKAVLARFAGPRSEEHTSELQSLMRISYAVFCLTKKTLKSNTTS